MNRQNDNSNNGKIPKGGIGMPPGEAKSVEHGKLVGGEAHKPGPDAGKQGPKSTGSHSDKK